jgi:hypothetical protein
LAHVSLRCKIQPIKYPIELVVIQHGEGCSCHM